MAQQLYTEEQVREMLQVCQDSDLYEDILTFDDILKTQIPIELPSDEEIAKHMTSVWFADNMHRECFKLGAKWMRDKILNPKKEKQSGTNQPAF
jgi:hypothetical protein